MAVRRMWLAVLLLGTPLVPAPATATVAHASLRDRRLVRATATSSNWAGYAASGATFTDVRASWKQPAVKCRSSALQASAFWVGLDGYTPTSTSVEQIGTDSDCKGLNRPQYSAWYEVVPAPSVPLPARDAVHPGDTMSAEVRGNGSGYTLVLKDWTAGWRFSTVQTSSRAQDSSAEWVAEAPSMCSAFICRVMPLADFGTVTFDNAAATTTAEPPATIGSLSHDKIVMVADSGAPKAKPSTLAGKGATFRVGWVRT